MTIKIFTICQATQSKSDNNTEFMCQNQVKRDKKYYSEQLKIPKVTNCRQSFSFFLLKILSQKQ